MKPIHRFAILTATWLAVTAAGIISCNSGEETQIEEADTEGRLQTENLILITIDGLRWQELYTGADSLLIGHEEYVRHPEQLSKKFWDDDPLVRRQKLFPFFWSILSEEGQLYGNREWENKVDLTNEYRFSYPGYSELLTGYFDPDVDSNAKIPNPNTSVLEVIHHQSGFEGRVAAFASWDVFPYIINSERSGIPVNAGFEPLKRPDMTEREELLNEMLAQIPRPWGSVRHNAFTFHYALEHLKKEKPRLLYLAFDETDEFAHSGNYEGYLNSAHQFDAFVREIWETVQSDRNYQNRTTLVIATDHGRGTEPADNWRHHGDEIDGAEEVWLAVIGPDTPARGEIKEPGQFYQNQIAATVASLLGVTFESGHPAGDAIQSVLE